MCSTAELNSSFLIFVPVMLINSEALIVGELPGSIQDVNAFVKSFTQVEVCMKKRIINVAEGGVQKSKWRPEK